MERAEIEALENQRDDLLGLIEDMQDRLHDLEEEIFNAYAEADVQEQENDNRYRNLDREDFHSDG